MRRDDVQALFKRIPEQDHTKVVVVLAGGQSVNVDLLYRLDEHLLTVRGREAGSNDDGRAFFLPYDSISYLKLEKVVMIAELEAIYGVVPKPPAGSLLPPSEPAKPAATPLPPTDPAGVARANLLARIQAARTSAGVPNKPAG